jgi:hypothetical protein
MLMQNGVLPASKPVAGWMTQLDESGVSKLLSE